MGEASQEQLPLEEPGATAQAGGGEANPPPAAGRAARFTGFWGREPDHSARGGSFFISRWLFLRGLGLIYLIAFVSLYVQIDGLMGSEGILPARELLSLVKERLGTRGYWLFPTLSWLDPEGGLLHAQCLTGVILACLLTSGIAPKFNSFGLWALYLSLCVTGQDFLGFQWDVLLLETGFLAVFLAPWGWWPSLRLERPVPLEMVWLTRFLLFKLMFSSGLVKLLSGDVVWRDMSALSFHYLTQPLPTRIAWYADKLPAWFQQVSVMIMFIIELAAPFLIFFSRRLPLLAGGSFVFLMILIGVTGNYCFFNLLTVLLCLMLVDDGTWREALPASWFARLPEPGRNEVVSWRSILSVVLAGALGVLSLLAMLSRLVPMSRMPAAGVALLRCVSPLRTFNSYGLFSIMTTKRNEIVIEGSMDGVQWRGYEFKWKPGDLKQAPRWVQPHQPRLDWQMWFAALDTFEGTSWFQSLMVRLLQESPPVLALLKENPFPGRPPRFVRAVLYEYHFTTAAERREKGTWWRRERMGMYCGPLSLRPAQTAPEYKPPPIL